MDTNISACNLEEIKRLQTELTNNVMSIRNVLMGLEYPLDKLFLKRKCLDMELIDSAINEILIYTECTEEMKAFYRELYCCIILYLYTANIRKRDIILLAVYKIAATFNLQTTNHYFADTTFGIMLSDLWDVPEAVEMTRMTDGELAVDVLKQHAMNLEKIYNSIKGRFSSADIVRNAIEIYAAVHGWSSLSNQEWYDSAISSVITARLDAQYVMRKGSDLQ